MYVCMYARQAYIIYQPVYACVCNIHVCMYARMHVCMYVYTHAFMHVCMYPCAAKQLFTLPDLCTSSLRRGHASLLCIVPILTECPQKECMYVCMHACTHACMYACMEVRTYMHVFTHITYRLI